MAVEDKSGEPFDHTEASSIDVQLCPHVSWLSELGRLQFEDFKTEKI